MAFDTYNIEYPQDLPGNMHSPLGMNLMTNASYASGWAFVDGWKHARQWISQKPVWAGVKAGHWTWMKTGGYAPWPWISMWKT